LLHDIGKIGVADSILLKPGELDASEWEEMHRHDVIGEEIVRKSFQHEGLTDIIRFHHIWYDGSKHPDIDMRGDEIPLGARILAIADSYDAMVSDRPYRKGIQSTDALEELNKFAGTQFDPAIVEVFTEIILAREEVNKPEEVNRLPDEVIVCLGEQIERVIDAVDHGDRETFLALADRMRMTAEQNDIPGIAAAASHAVDVASEDSQLEELAYESFELLKACRSIHSAVAPTPKAAKQI
jgi:hypothetical protein